MYTPPPNAALGASGDAQEAWAGLSESDQKDRKAQVRDIMDTVIKTTTPTASPIHTYLSKANSAGTISNVGAYANSKDSANFAREPSALRYTPTDCDECSPTATPSPTPDADHDGLPDTFENDLADGFTPRYLVSGGENPATGFATFNNSTPQVVSQVFGATPVRSYYRVTPLRIRNTPSGIRYGFIQIDYLTLWNRDDGLVSGNIAGALLNPLELTSHPLDNERAALLAAAPSVGGGFNLNLQSYKVYEAYTASHEGTFFDQSYTYEIDTPFDFNDHVFLGLALSKHGTYGADPDYLPLVPDWVISATYFSIYLLYHNQNIDFERYLELLAAANFTFYEIIVERFHNTGSALAGTRTNVGELNYPLNNCGFINAPEIRSKFNFHF